jgi:POT family proton-dependent oligopeptide transporter
MTATAADDELFGHPKGLVVCFFTEMWERFSFYGMKALLALYLIKHHGFTDTMSLALIGAYGGLVYATPMLGGLIADRWLGVRRSVVLGGVLLALGHLGMSVEGAPARVVGGVVERDALALTVFYASLALIASGVGFLKPNISTLVGRLYPARDPRRDAGFTLFGAGINFGSLFASVVCGFLGETYGWRYGFGAAGIGMVAGLAVFVGGRKYLLGHAESPDDARLKARVLGPLTLEWAIYLGALLTLPILFLLMQAGHAVLWLQLGLIALWLGWLAWYLAVRCTPVQRGRMLACLGYVALGLLFFALYEQGIGSWVLFTDRLLEKDFFPSLVVRDGQPLPWSALPMAISPLVVAAALRAPQGARWPARAIALLAVAMVLLVIRDVVVLPQTASSLTFLGPLLSNLMAPFAAALWPWLARRGCDPHPSLKGALGLLFGGLAFIPMLLAAQRVADPALGLVLAGVWWLVFANLLIEIGSLLIYPIGLSAVTTLSVPAVGGVMMGGWWLGTSFAEQVAAGLGTLAAIDRLPGETVDAGVAASAYAALFGNLVWLGVGSAALALLLVPVMRRWTRDAT